MLVPAKHLNILIGVLVQLADAAVDVIGNALVAGITDGLLNRFCEQHVLVGMLFKHPLQEKWPPRLLQLRPELLAGFIELVFVRYVPNRFDVEPLHLLCAASVNSTIVEEEIELIVVASRCSYLPEEGLELLLVEGVVFDLIR